MATESVVVDTTTTAGTFTAVGAATLHEAMDDTPGAPNDTDYATASGANTSTVHGYVSFTFTATAIASLTYAVRARRTGVVSLTPTIRKGNVNYALTNVVITSGSFLDYSADYLTDPSTGVAWTNLAACNFDDATNGLRLQTSGLGAAEVIDVSQLYFTATYTPVAAPEVEAPSTNRIARQSGRRRHPAVSSPGGFF